MSKALVIVESPAKSKTIEKYLGDNFKVMASYGHVRDLVPHKGAVSPENGFQMNYDLIEKNKKHVSEIVKALKNVDTLYLAPDPDREGEAIAWHVFEILQEKGALKNKSIKRIVFHEITKSALLQAIENPRNIDMNLVNAQQARRALDYLVGFNLSPLLWKKIKPKLSAGRVQSPALRLIVEREKEIEKFQSREYWSIAADCDSTPTFSAKLVKYQNQKVEQFTFTNQIDSENAKNYLLENSKGILTVGLVDKKLKKRYPVPPFTTSTLQQEAHRKLGFSARKTMMIAQQLYEGIDLGNHVAGLITYMRTDSVHLSNEAISEIRDVISNHFGSDYIPESPNAYKTKSKNAQEAHEGIRPTSSNNLPNEIKKHLTTDQFKLYDLIWKRTVASQMVPATLDTVAISFTCGTDGLFRTNGSVIIHKGFLAAYAEGIDDSVAEDDECFLPSFQVGDTVKLNDIICDQHFTEPPPRYTEATLVKTLEEYGIGRPSTYASIIHTLQLRGYATLVKKRFQPTDIGVIVCNFLSNYFIQYVDYGFTATLEDDLDSIARGEKLWVPVLEDFWKPFKEKVDDIEKTVQKKDVVQEKTDQICPKCEKPLVIRLGRGGRFIGCTGYPECNYTTNLDGTNDEQTENEIVHERHCPKCQSELHIKHGRYGKFIGCSAYPNCKHIEPLEKPEDTGVACPECNQGNLVKRKSRFGKIFYSCSRYPDCKYSVWNEPITEPCPKCHWPIMTIKTTKRKGTEKVCPQKQCGYSEPME